MMSAASGAPALERLGMGDTPANKAAAVQIQAHAIDAPDERGRASRAPNQTQQSTSADDLRIGFDPLSGDVFGPCERFASGV